jgi:hypothetical protein
LDAAVKTHADDTSLMRKASLDAGEFASFSRPRALELAVAGEYIQWMVRAQLESIAASMHRCLPLTFPVNSEKNSSWATQAGFNRVKAV